MAPNETQASPAEVKRVVQRHILACMETGNIAQARTALAEYAEASPKDAASIRADVAASYGTFL